MTLRKWLRQNIALTLALLTLIAIISTTSRPALARISFNTAEKIGPGIRVSELLVKAAGALNNKDAKLAFYTGLWHHQQHELKKAEKFYKKALEFDPKIANTHYQLARVYYIQSRFSEALSEINKELEINPANQRSYYIRGLIYGYSGKLKEAEADFKTFIASPLSQEVNGWGGYNDLAWVLIQEKKYNEAIEILKTAEKLFPRNAWLENGLGGAYLAIKNYQKSKEYYQMALEDAGKLTEKDWLLAYPAHDPKTAKDGIRQIIEGLNKNLSLINKRFSQ